MKEKYVSSKEIIAKVYRDGGFSGELPWADLITWIDEALRRVDHPQQFVRKVLGDKSNPALDITDYKAKLPCNIYKIEQIAVNGLPAYRSTDTFHHLISDKCCTAGQSGFQEDLFETSFRDIVVDGNVITSRTYTNNPISGNSGPAPIITYDINDDFISLSTREGKVCIAYLSYPIDEDGFPLIPDLQQYKDMTAAYLHYMLIKRGWIQQLYSDAVYRAAKADYEWYVGAAAGKIKLPDVDQAQAMLNQIVRLKPNMNAYVHFFTDLGLPEIKPIQR